MEGGEKPKEEEESLPPSLVVEVLSEYMKIPITQCEVTTMAKIRALAQPNEEKRAPITICAAIDRRWGNGVCGGWMRGGRGGIGRRKRREDESGVEIACVCI